MKKPHEIVYFNNGQIYKDPTHYELMNTYLPVQDMDFLFSFKKIDGKYYYPTVEFKKHYDGKNGILLNGIDLCPAVTLWICLGAPSPEERTNFDIFFAVDSTGQLRDVANYYNLPYPVSQEISDKIDNSPNKISFGKIGKKYIVVAAVKFIDSKPAILKLYTYPKHHFDDWDLWMYGISYYDGGRVWEAGAVYEKPTGGEVIQNSNMIGKGNYMKSQRIISERADGKKIHYFFTGPDPFMFWRGDELDNSGAVVDRKLYETSKMVRLALAHWDSGPDMSEYKLCPDVKIWLGRSWFENRNEEELLFCVTGGSRQLTAVSRYYNLPYPCNSEMTKILNTTPELYRARHYDLYRRGEGRFVPVVVASIVFANGIPSKLLLYTFLRQWEFEDQIELPNMA